MIVPDAEKCTGCGACAQACPKKCISMENNGEGFLFPVVDRLKCAGCGICTEKCPLSAGGVPVCAPSGVYAAYAEDAGLLQKSTSGGVCAVAAKEILRQGGVVFGAKMSRDFRVRIIYIEKEEDLPELQGSKYVQAETGVSYREAAYFLQTGRKVLFTGTPCQIAGLRKFLGKDYEGLYTIDLVCHGVSSPGLFVSYVRYMEKKHGQNIKRWSFRDKSVDGWKVCDLIEFENKTVKQRELLDPYTYTFLIGRSFRESCYTCPYAQKERCGDITCGDYWGIKKAHPEIPEEQGVSVLLVNTQKGEELFSAVKGRLKTVESRFSLATENNPNLSHPQQRPPERRDFYKKWAQMPMKDFVKEYMRPAFDIRETVRQYIPPEIRKRIKTLFGKCTGKKN